jgi:photosystem II stability/assembly factor-like uncharacterized protein
MVFPQANFWQPTNGPYGGFVYALAINANGHLFAGTYEGGIFRSMDGGESWEHGDNGLKSKIISALAINANGHIFAGTELSGAFRSTDNGNSWQEINNGLASNFIDVFAINQNGHIFAGNYLGEIYRSTNNGDTWTKLNSGWTNTGISSIAINSNGHIFVATFHQGVFRSTDNGNSWTQVYYDLFNPTMNHLVINSQGFIFGATFNGVLYSIDNGNTWTKLDNNFNKAVLSLVINTNGHIFAGTNRGEIFRLIAIGMTWEALYLSPVENFIETFVINSSGRIFAGTFGRGVLRSKDNGNNWTEVNQGLTNTIVEFLATNEKGYIFARILDNGLFRSKDNGESWTQLNNELSVYRIKTIVNNSKGHMFAAISSVGVFRSTDDGDSWGKINTAPMNILSLAISIDDKMYAGSSQGVFRSTDDGQNWVRVGASFSKAVVHLAINSLGHIFAATESDGLYRSIDFGENWIAVNAGLLNLNIVALVVNSNEAVFVGTSDGVFRSTDNGNSWKEVSNGLTSKYILSLASNSLGHIFVGIGGVFRSIDNGDNWTEISTGLPNRYLTNKYAIETLVITPDGYAFGGTRYAGIFRSVESTGAFKPNTTIITHGFRASLLTPEWKDYKWQLCMADATSNSRQLCLISDGKAYRTYSTYSDFASISDEDDWDEIISTHFTTVLNLNPNKNVVFVFDWVEESDRDTQGYAEAAADALAAVLIKLAKQYTWLLEDLHFIGHSRGTVVNSECIERLIYHASQGILPEGVDIDPEIHKTTLDPHPAGHWLGQFESMNDDEVNSENIVVQENGKSKRIGVVGWIGGNDYRTGFIDNFYQTDDQLIGLAYYPGLNKNDLQSNVDLTALLQNATSAHSLVHSWYHGTIDLNRNNDGFGTGNRNEILRDSWYIDGLGAYQGFYYSRLREGNINEIQSVSTDLINITEDKNYGQEHLIFNGDFRKNPLSSPIIKWIPGWEFHGGGGDGKIELDYGDMRLSLDNGNESKIHNYFYIPTNENLIFFKYRVIQRSDDDVLNVKINERKAGQGFHLSTKMKSYEMAVIDITNIPPFQFQGGVHTLTFEIENQSGEIDSKVFIDDIGFRPKETIRATVASPVNLHAYDSFGNHTGPTSDSTWITEIPGSQYFVLDDSSEHPPKTILLPIASQGVPYSFRIESLNNTGFFDFYLEEYIDGFGTAITVFDSVLIQPHTIAACTLQNVTPNLNLQVDIDGNGQFETTMRPSDFFKNLKIVATASPNGKINPSDNNIANYGDSLTFTITPNSGYVIADVMVDSISVGAVSSYTFYNIVRNHRIDATFSSSTGVKEDISLPKEMYLSQNYPNPFNPFTQIRFGLPKPTHVKIEVTNILGQKITTLVDAPKAAGHHVVEFDASRLGGGVYLYSIQAGEITVVRKMLFLK